MRDPEQLRESLGSVEHWIRRQLTSGITHPYKDAKLLGKRLWGLQSFYRVRGILKYLLDADTDAFFSDLAREALTYVTLLRAYREKMDVPESRVKGSTYGPFACAMAGGNWEACVEMDQLMPRQFGKYDGKEVFAFTTVLRRLAVSNEAEIAAAERELVDACAGVEWYDAAIQMVHGLTQQNEAGFNSGLAAYLAYMEDLPPEEAGELRPGEEFISIEALAFIQLARKRNIKRQVQHRMIPPELQEAKPVVPKNGYPSWPG